jgi:DNA-binding PadR family transcriptional regulator
MTGKSIINEITERSDNSWTPSPGLIYPLLGRLVRDGFIHEHENGKYGITEAGQKELEKYEDIQTKIDSQYSLFNKLGLGMFTVGKFLSERALDSIRTASRLSIESMSKRSSEVQESFNTRYRDFLVKELERLDKKLEEHS